MAESEPEIKRPRIERTFEMQMYDVIYSKQNLECILCDEFYDPIPLIEMCVGHIKNVKDISTVLKILNEKIPLKKFPHLKRVLRNEILLCPAYCLNGSQETIQDYINVHTSELTDTFDYFKTVEVLALPPLTRKQFNEHRKWSYNFHPNKYFELMTSDNIFSPVDLAVIRAYMGVTFEIVINYQRDLIDMKDFILTDDINATLVVDPVSRTIVAAAYDNRNHHPTQHSAMLAIDNVAKSQDGGAWTAKDSDSVNAYDPELLQYTKERFTVISRYIARKDVPCVQKEDVAYLCTGYDVYMLREPCMMCAMALVHARAKRVFFCYQNTTLGALKSIAKLQTVSSLNHHFEVFTGFL